MFWSQPQIKEDSAGLDAQQCGGCGKVAERTDLKRGLSGRHMQMIAIGGAIGSGLFVASGATLALPLASRWGGTTGLTGP